MAVTNLAELDALVARVKEARREFASFSQEQVDKIFRAAAGRQPPVSPWPRWPWLSPAWVSSKTRLSRTTSPPNTSNAYKDEKTCGILSEDDEMGTITIAEPVGIICGIVPTTNPTSTAIFKALISLKTRNAIIFSPHPRAKNSTNTAAKLVLDAAIAAGAPKTSSAG
jgi:acetaldehyde dehydrogenase/alcohol dehydrogenase